MTYEKYEKIEDRTTHKPSGASIKMADKYANDES